MLVVLLLSSCFPTRPEHIVTIELLYTTVFCSHLRPSAQASKNDLSFITSKDHIKRKDQKRKQLYVIDA